MPPTQIARPFRVKTTLGDDALLLDSFAGTESISAPFHFVLHLLSENPNIDLKGLLKKPIVLTMALEDSDERHLHGILSAIKLVEHGRDGMLVYAAEVVPWLWLLNLFTNCRIFQNKSAPDIIEQVFKDRGFSDFRLDLQGSFPTREYCVQYRETDFNFVSRLMEEEGIFYFFEHTDEKHTLVLANAPAAIKDCPHQSRIHYQSSTGGALKEETVLGFEEELRIHTGSVSLNDYDFEKPATSLLASLDGELPGEDYDFPGNYTLKADGDRYARIRLEEREARLVTVRGKSNCMSLRSGYKFTLADYVRDEANQAYTVIRVDHSGRNTSYSAGTPDPFEYSNRFECIPNSVPFRPPRLARKPFICGAQTAVVVGKSGEEIWTDQYGRVKVHFFWDRLGKYDENESCWIRVSQTIAGKQWGAVNTPRIGQEVIVSFIEGDPDRPIITGRVYNADQMPPYTLPGEQTKSTIKTLSSKGGGGYNEIRMEDSADNEQVYMHAAKDLDIRVEKDRKEWIGQDRHLIVKRDRVDSVERDTHATINRDHILQANRDQHINIQGKEAVKIAGSKSLAVQGNVIESFSADHSEQVTQNYYLKAMQVVIEAATGITLKVGGNFVTIDPSGVAIKGTLIQLNSGGAALSGNAGSLVSPTAPANPDEADKAGKGSTSTPSGTQDSIRTTEVSDISSVAARVARSTAPTHDPNSPENKKKKHWIEIELKDEAGQPVAGEKYRVTVPDGTVAEGTLDDKGKARIDGIDPGNCNVTFPNLDKETWDKG